ncbi:MAG TPA: RNA methyltransferase [bacterium]|nr:RNA methyltransferase [bacterium]
MQNNLELRIESPQNKTIKSFVELNSRKGRKQTGHFLADGIRIVREALNAKNSYVHNILISEELETSDSIRKIVDLCIQKRIRIYYVPRQLMKKVSRSETTQGVVAEVSMKKELSISDADFSGLSILAHGIQDPRNMGLLIRTAEAAGVSAFFAPPGSTDPFNPTAVQTSMGAVFHHPIIAGEDSSLVIETAREEGAQIVGTSVSGGLPVTQWMENPPEKLMLVMGNEGTGLDYEITKQLDLMITLPMWGKTESLNVAVSSGIILYLARFAGMEKQDKEGV